MTLFDILPVLAGLATVAAVLIYAHRPRTLGPQAWIAAATLCAAFAGWSLYAIATGGPFGFWVEHTRNAWGVQIWFDLLLRRRLRAGLHDPRSTASGHATPCPGRSSCSAPALLAFWRCWHGFSTCNTGNPAASERRKNPLRHLLIPQSKTVFH